ncbi:hypothetical protein [Methanolapillus millepedarum]|uniref:Uncharacterized protein n=1 Tax=Methanolapillus millepedarum TaxID=3028296 RepID=A0AA97A4X0_9EURY|nr:hypothetical protein MsAc7_17110 [Methanosarcinaceae archaeon Ac7]
MADKSKWLISILFLLFLLTSIVFVFLALFFLKEASSHDADYLFKLLLLMIGAAIFEVFIYGLVFFKAKRMNSNPSAINIYSVFIVLMAVVSLFCFYAYMMIAIFGSEKYSEVTSTESIFNFFLLLVNIVLVAFTGYNLFTINKKSQNELKEKNINSDIGFLKSQLDCYFIPLHTIFYTFLIEVGTLDWDTVDEETEHNVAMKINSKIMDLNALIRQYAYLGSEAVAQDSAKFILDFIFYDSIRTESNLSKNERKMHYKDLFRKLLPAESNYYSFIENEFDKHFDGFDEAITPMEAFKTCLNDISIVIEKLDRTIFQINNQIVSKLKYLKEIKEQSK